MMLKNFWATIRQHPVLFGILFVFLSLCIFLHICALMHREQEREVEITLRAEHLPPELLQAIEEEEQFLLDGRFSLYKTDFSTSPTLLRFYDAKQRCEFSVPSKKYSDLEMTLCTVAREHPFGMALYGVRTVNVGMHLSLFGEKTKIYGTCTAIRALETG